ncbi:MAG: DNA polymerase III subunit delta' [Candidatus Omnitrophica bacterium]|nr:DNA polymerase III subunit delta' [Candidatus Omnitrophota bacterium]MCB9747576.1 DNA polymerase III subunit delta' [Candidatus Omnitrophota bacterium]
MAILQEQVNSEIIDRISRLHQRQRLAHAYLFVGAKGSGKKATALAVAKLINCVNPGSCNDQCSSCKKINTGSHPDIFLIDGQEETIKIDQIRGLLNQSNLRPYEARVKVFIIHHIENMTLESSNALLKTLEEPSANSLIILTTAVPERNLDTIKSRCHFMYFLPVSNRVLEKNLEQYYDDKDEIRFLAYFAQGCLGRAHILKENNVFGRKNSLIDDFIYARDVDAFIKEITADNVQMKEFLSVLYSWVRDAVLLKSGTEENYLINRDRIQDLKAFQKSVSFSDLNEVLNEITNAYKLLTDNLNIKIPLMILKERMSWVN